MAYAYIMHFAGGTTADYDAVMEQMALGGHLPAGALFHAVGPADGGLLVCDVWDDAGAFHRFAETKIGPLSAQQGMAPPAMRSFAVHEIRRGPAGGAPVGFMQVVGLPDMDAERFERLDREITGADRRVPAGCVFHVNGRMDGTYMVLDYWTSRAERDAFMEANVRPTMEADGIAAPSSMEEVDVHASLTEHAPSAARA